QHPASQREGNPGNLSNSRQAVKTRMKEAQYLVAWRTAGAVTADHGAPLSAGGASPVKKGGERGEDHQERDGPQQRGGYRVLHGPGVDGCGGIGVAPQVAGGGGDRADRVPVGD